VIYSLFVLVFSIMMLQLQGGMLFRCTVDSGWVNGTAKMVDTRKDCTDVGGEWHNSQLNYDNIFHAMFRVHYISMLDGWVALMFESMDVVGVDMQPKKDNSFLMAPVHVAVVLLLNYVVLNLLIGIVLDSFKSGGISFDDGVEDITAPVAIAEAATPEDRDPWREYVASVCDSEAFQISITVVIVINMATLCGEHYNQPARLTLVFDILNYIFLTVFVGEAALKLYALGYSNYFADSWNQVDLGIVVAGIVDIFADLLVHNDVVNVTMLRILRVFRIARVVKFIRFMSELRILVTIMLGALQGIWGLFLLLLLMLFVFAAIGVELMGRMACTKSSPCIGISQHSNFENMGMALLMLFRYSTRDNGEGLARDILRTAPQCNDSVDCKYNCCVNAMLGSIYLVAFSLIVSFIVLNIMIAMLMELANRKVEQLHSLGTSAADPAVQAWAEEATGPSTHEKPRPVAMAAH